MRLKIKVSIVTILGKIVLRGHFIIPSGIGNVIAASFLHYSTPRTALRSAPLRFRLARTNRSVPPRSTPNILPFDGHHMPVDHQDVTGLAEP